MDASCGPANALSQLSKHTQRDNSLQHERQHLPGNLAPSAFRNGPGIDARLNQDFHRFNQGTSSDFQAHSLQNQNTYAPAALAPMGPRAHGGRNQEWVQDFRGLSLEEQSRAHAQSTGQKDGWHLQFMQNMQNLRNMPQMQTMQTMQSVSQNGWQNMQAHQPMMGLPGHQLHETQLGLQTHQHSDLHMSQIDDQALSRHFDMIEQELEQGENQAPQTHRAEQPGQAKQEHDNVQPVDDTEKQHFADAARQVHQLMVTGHAQQSQETAHKFQQSDFLKLMSQILDRLVELSKEGDKLVQKSTGDDIRQHLSDPLRHERSHEPDYHSHEPDYHVPPHGSVPADLANFPQTTNESQNIRSHLPDPLAHIRDGALDGDLTSLQAAQVVSGGQVQGGGWMEDDMWESEGRPAGRGRPSLMSQEDQEVYDDYRNDDY